MFAVGISHKIIWEKSDVIFCRRIAGKEFKILYLETDDVQGSIEVIKRERSDEQGTELWFPMMCEYFNHSPYAEEKGVSGMEGLIAHLEHRQMLELRICREVFPEQTVILKSKKYGEIGEIV